MGVVWLNVFRCLQWRALIYCTRGYEFELGSVLKLGRMGLLARLLHGNYGPGDPFYNTDGPGNPSYNSVQQF